MKKIFLLAAILFSLNSQAQTLYFDTQAGMVYAKLVPQAIPWVYGDSISRLYIQTRGVNVIYDAGTSSILFNLSIDYYIKYPVVVDSSTTNWFVAAQGNISYSVPPTLTFAQTGQRAVTYIADSATLNGHFLNLTIAP